MFEPRVRVFVDKNRKVEAVAIRQIYHPHGCGRQWPVSDRTAGKKARRWRMVVWKEVKKGKGRLR